MPELKLAKLPDRTPVKISISVSPDLHAALRDYAEAYRTTYGTGESVAELIPYMLSAFIDRDVGFKKARRDRQKTAVPSSVPKKPERSAPSPAISNPVRP